MKKLTKKWFDQVEREAVVVAKRGIQNELPEDEPDTIPNWCYRKIVREAVIYTVLHLAAREEAALCKKKR